MFLSFFVKEKYILSYILMIDMLYNTLLLFKQYFDSMRFGLLLCGFHPMCIESHNSCHLLDKLLKLNFFDMFIQTYTVYRDIDILQ